MKHDPIASGKRKPLNVSIDTGIVAAAREAGLNLSQISEAALLDATQAAKRERWIRENQAALEGWGRWIEENGLPLEKYRLF